MIHGLGISQSAKGKDVAQNHNGSMYMRLTVGGIKLVTGKINLHFSSRDMGIVIRKFIRILVITDVFLELCIPIDVGRCLEVFLM